MRLALASGVSDCAFAVKKSNYESSRSLERPSMTNNKQCPFVSLVTVFALVLSLCSGILSLDGRRAQSGTTKPNSTSTTKNSALDRYAENLTKLARHGAFNSVKVHEAGFD